MQDYVLHPGLPTFWVDLQRDQLKNIEPSGRIVLDNQKFGRYEIPFSAISKYFVIDDMTVYKWTMRLTSRVTQPNYFTIQSKRILPDGRRENTVLVDDFDATKYFVSDLQKGVAITTTASENLSSVLTASEKEEIAEATSQFEMENELEGFISQNWDSIFPEYEKVGRQVSAEFAGRMDFLGKHKKTGHFRVWELKRNESDDSALAQVLRYMGYISQKLAGGDNSKVSGAIICLKQGEALKLAISQLGGKVTVMEYEVRFRLKPAET